MTRKKELKWFKRGWICAADTCRNTGIKWYVISRSQIPENFGSESIWWRWCRDDKHVWVCEFSRNIRVWRGKSETTLLWSGSELSAVLYPIPTCVKWRRNNGLEATGGCPPYPVQPWPTGWGAGGARWGAGGPSSIARSKRHALYFLYTAVRKIRQHLNINVTSNFSLAEKIQGFYPTLNDGLLQLLTVLLDTLNTSLLIPDESIW